MLEILDKTVAMIEDEFQAEQSKIGIAIVDVNGGPLRPRKGYASHLVTSSLSTDFISNLRQVIMQPVGPGSYTGAFAQALGVLYPKEDALVTHGTVYLPRQLADWKLLTRETPLEIPDKTQMSEEERKQYERDSEFFENYDISPRDFDILHALREKRGDSTLISGVPFTARERFRRELGRCWEDLNPWASAVLNPDPNMEIVSGIHIKTAGIGIFSRIDRVYVTHKGEIIKLTGLRRVFMREDDSLVAAWESYLWNLRIYMTVTLEEAKKQVHSRDLEWPPLNLRGDIVYDPTGEKMLEDAANPAFENFPELLTGIWI